MTSRREILENAEDGSPELLAAIEAQEDEHAFETGEAGWVCSKHGTPVGDVGCLTCVNEAEAGAAYVADGMLFDEECLEMLAQARGLLNKAWLVNMQAPDYQWDQDLGHKINDVYNAVSGLIEQRIYGRKAL